MKNENVDGYRFVNKAKKDREQLELSRVLMKLGSSMDDDDDDIFSFERFFRIWLFVREFLNKFFLKKKGFILFKVFKTKGRFLEWFLLERWLFIRFEDDSWRERERERLQAAKKNLSCHVLRTV